MGRRRRLCLILVAGSLLVLCAPALSASAKPTGKRQATAAQIRAAVAHARRARTLWATVNICDTKRFPDVIGVRAQMPTLGLGERLSMAFRIDYWATASRSFLPVPNTKRTVSLGSSRTGLHQGGWWYRFAPHAGLLRGSVTFAWTLGGRVIGRAQRTTTAGHGLADFGDPAHYSTAACTIS
jgi:hypothetical protein